MQSSSSKKVVAAISAVLQYIEAETVPALPLAPQVVPAAPGSHVWGVAGRQDAMLFRTLWQRRLGRGC